MSTTVVIGTQWGDEGKGRVVDEMAEYFDIVARYQGGGNAGHSIRTDLGKFALHLLPSGVLRPGVINVIAPAVALNVDLFFKELAELAGRGVPAPYLIVSDRVELLLPYHILLDKCEEARRGAAKKFGSTQSGIAPFYSDKARKIGIQACDLCHEGRLRDKLENALAINNALLAYYNDVLDETVEQVELEPLLKQLLKYGQEIAPYLRDTTQFFHLQLAAGKQILLEGQLGAMRDLIHGNCPYTTSSQTLAGFAPAATGIALSEFTRIIGVVKAYSSSVGAGPFVVKLEGPEGEELQRRGGDGGEVGTTTGRKRDVGWLDLVATRYGCKVQGATEIAFTVMDILGYRQKIPVCVAYEINGKVRRNFPDPATLGEARITPVYEVLDGWHCDIREIRKYKDLPSAARYYVEFVEGQLGRPITMVSVGPARGEMIYR